jgi:hypothetical protein
MDGHVACMEEKRCACKTLVGKLRGKNLEDLRVDRKILLKWIVEQFNGRNTVAQDRHSGELL